MTDPKTAGRFSAFHGELFLLPVEAQNAIVQPEGPRTTQTLGIDWSRSALPFRSARHSQGVGFVNYTIPPQAVPTIPCEPVEKEGK